MTDTNLLNLEQLINLSWDNRANINITNASQELRGGIEMVMGGLNNGSIRVAVKKNVGHWKV